ncbi:MAG: glycoside hydrolase family 28 protein [Cellulosilyticaceae bacterium]
MEVLRVLTQSCRSVTLEVVNEEAYYSQEAYRVYLDDKCVIDGETKNVFSLYQLLPQTEYTIKVEKINEGTSYTQKVTTDAEYVRLNVKQFGAVGNGKIEDTAALQCTILACPDGGCVYIPKGTYLTGPLFLRSNITIELAEEAVLLGMTDRDKYPILPGYTVSEDEQREYYLGTWEGNPLDMMASLITGINVENVKIIGKGILDGNAQNGDWWLEPKKRNRAWRPRMIFLNNCKNIEVQGITVKNSPCWTVHPYFSENLKFIDMQIINPSHSPNTDGIDPESCEGVQIIGTKISVGDDCIAIKSGKLFMGKKFKKPSENFIIRNCLMERGHGAVVLGSEIAGGVRAIAVSQCIFKQTDRGLRIKTRRGRGKDSIVDQITFQNIKMTEVMTPFVINMFYFCDPDGKSEYVWSKAMQTVDDWTPMIGSLTFKDIECEACEVAAAYFYGLPERPIEHVTIQNVSFKFKDEATCDTPAMMSFIEPVSKLGLFANNINKLTLENVKLEGYVGERMIIENIKEISER